MMVFEGETFGRWLGYEGKALMNGISALIKETPGSSHATSTMWGHSKKMAIYESGSRPSPDIKADNTLLLEFPVPRRVKNKFLLLISHGMFIAHGILFYIAALMY